MRYLIMLSWISCLCSFQAAFACKCTRLPKLDSLSQLSTYKFIAHVVITDDGDKVAATNFDETGTLRFKIITLFKGEAVEQLLEYEKNSSCDMGISKGQEWILFGILTDGKLSIRACDRNIMYRETSGERDWVFKRGIEDLEKLQELYKTPAKFYPDGVYICKYKNGNKELEETYLDNKLQGSRKLWYPGGQLRATENYIHGLQDGKSEWFYPSGQIYREAYFKEGKNYNVSRVYYDTIIDPAWKNLLIADFYQSEDSLKADFSRIQAQYESVYNAAGEQIISRQYYRTGQIQSENFIGRDNEHGVSVHYYSNGLIHYISTLYNQTDRGLYQEFQRNGQLKRAGMRDENGKLQWNKP